jgi:hypothetical protein
MRSALVLVALLLAGCTPMQWIKADTTPEQMNKDALECQQYGWREARLRAGFPRPWGPVIVHDAAGHAFVVWPEGPFADPFNDPFMEEGRLAQFCMRSRGYELVPVEAGKQP